MNEGWVVFHGKSRVFLLGFACPPRLHGTLPIWTPYLEKAKRFPSEQGATAIIEEWCLEGMAEPCVICTSDS